MYLHFLVAIDRRCYGNPALSERLTEVRASQTVNTVAEKDVQILIHQATAGELGTGRRIVRILVALTIAGGMGVLAAWGIIEGRSQAAREAERAAPVQVPSRVKLDDGGDPAVILDERTRKRSGVEVITALPIRYQEQVRAYGTVMDLDNLTTLHNRYVTAVAQIQSAQAKLVASKAAFERAQDLLKSRYMALAQLQAAEAAFGVDQAALATAQAQVKTIRATAFEEWGPAIGKALVEGDALVSRLIEREAFLIQITLRPGMSIDPPPTATVQLSDSVPRVEVRFLSVASQADPKIQGFSFYYVADAGSRLLPGMSVLADLPVGASLDGVVVPASAIVWWGGRTWVYLRTGAETFKRHPIPTDPPATDAGGVVVPVAVFPRSPPDLVTRGAQALLSEELRAQIQMGGNDLK